MRNCAMGTNRAIESIPNMIYIVNSLLPTIASYAQMLAQNDLFKPNWQVFTVYIQTIL
jgi:hypothetical protein